jgi:hypothetical protein
MLARLFGFNRISCVLLIASSADGRLPYGLRPRSPAFYVAGWNHLAFQAFANFAGKEGAAILADQYRGYAESLMRLVRETESESTRATLFEIAATWHRLAQQQETPDRNGRPVDVGRPQTVSRLLSLAPCSARPLGRAVVPRDSNDDRRGT